MGSIDTTNSTTDRSNGPGRATPATYECEEDEKKRDCKKRKIYNTVEEVVQDSFRTMTAHQSPFYPRYFTDKKGTSIDFAMKETLRERKKNIVVFNFKSLCLWLVISIVGCSSSNRYDLAEIITNKECNENYEKIALELRGAEETSANIFKKILEKVPFWEEEGSIIEKRVRYLEQHLSFIEKSQVVPNIQEPDCIELGRKLGEIEERIAQTAISKNLGDARALKAVFRETVVAVQVGRPVTIYFPEIISTGVGFPSDLYSLHREKRSVRVTLHKKLPPAGIPFFVEMENGTMFSIRMLNSSRERKSVAEIYVNDSEDEHPFVCGQASIW